MLKANWKEGPRAALELSRPTWKNWCDPAFVLLSPKLPWKVGAGTGEIVVVDAMGPARAPGLRFPRTFTDDFEWHAAPFGKPRAGGGADVFLCARMGEEGPRES